MNLVPHNLQALRRRLARHRLENRMTFQELADAIGGVSPQTVMRFVDGSIEPRETTVFAVSEYLKAQGAVTAA